MPDLANFALIPVVFHTCIWTLARLWSLSRNLCARTQISDTTESCIRLKSRKRFAVE